MTADSVGCREAKPNRTENTPAPGLRALQSAAFMGIPRHSCPGVARYAAMRVSVKVQPRKHTEGTDKGLKVFLATDGHGGFLVETLSVFIRGWTCHRSGWPGAMTVSVKVTASPVPP